MPHAAHCLASFSAKGNLPCLWPAWCPWTSIAHVAVFVVAGAADVSGVGGDPRRRIDADLQAQAVDVVAQALHVREFLVALDGLELAAARTLPGVVDVDVGPAVIDQALIDHRLGRNFYLLGIDGAGPAVPTVPAHRRRQGDGLTDDDLQRLAVLAERFRPSVSR